MVTVVIGSGTPEHTGAWVQVQPRSGRPTIHGRANRALEGVGAGGPSKVFENIGSESPSRKTLNRRSSSDPLPGRRKAKPVRQESGMQKALYGAGWLGGGGAAEGAQRAASTYYIIGGPLSAEQDDRKIREQRGSDASGFPKRWPSKALVEQGKTQMMFGKRVELGGNRGKRRECRDSCSQKRCPAGGRRQGARYLEDSLHVGRDLATDKYTRGP